ncbi:MAG: ABC transporter permease subunit [Nocardioides sp.]
MTTLATRPVEPGAAPPVEEEKPLLPRWAWVLLVLVGWLGVWVVTKGNQTLEVGGLDTLPLHDRLSDFYTSINDNAVTQTIGDLLRGIVEFFQGIIASPVPPRAAPQIGWLGVVAIATWIGYAVANWRIALLVALSFLSFGALGFWEDSMDLLIVTGVSVAIAVLIGFPLAIWLGLSKRASVVITLFIDLLQTMPTFVYLVFILVFFGIGVPTAIVCTLIYALPPIVRIAGFGIREVSPTTIEATDSLGQTTMQRLWQVQIPMAKSTIILGLNQTVLAALSMAIIASYISGPGLGKPVLNALTINNFGKGLVPGILIVVMGIMLDRTITAASQRAEKVTRGGIDPSKHRRVVLALLVPTVVAVWYSRWSLEAAIFPELDWGNRLAEAMNNGAEPVIDALEPASAAFKDLISYGLLNPMQALLADSPWWLAFVGLVLISGIIGGTRALVPTLLCLTGIRLLGLWNDSMKVLNMTIVATLLCMILALVVGVWMARSSRVDLLVRPLLDGGQTIPAFVYLIPVLALFGPTRFTAIIAGLVYAAPAAIKLVADGIHGVAPGAIEASRSSGTTKMQEILGVQLPMAKGALVLATNQGLLYVLSMVVIGGLVGAQALGYDVVLGLAHTDKWGKGLAAGLSIVLLGIWIDRVAKSAAARSGSGYRARERAFMLGGWRPAIFTNRVK